MLLAHDHSELDATLADVFSALEAGQVERSFRSLDVFWARLAMHIRAENIHLFPALREASTRPRRAEGAPPQQIVRDIITRLCADHDFFMIELAAAVKQLRKLRRGERQDTGPLIAKVREQMSRVRDRLETHNELEESQAYHWAGLLLDLSEQKSLNEAIQRELNNFPARFHSARRSEAEKFC
jgi:hypothetical protein